MFIYGIVDTQEDDYITYYLHKDKAIEELKLIHESWYKENKVKPNPIMYDVDICVAQFSIRQDHHVYIVTQEVIE